jgi:hypothetical protein
VKALVVVFAVAVLAPRAHAKGCHEVSRVVGYEHCFRFGGWSRDENLFPFRLEIGWIHQSFTAQPFTLPTGSVARESTDTGSLGTITDGASVRWLGGGRLVYGGLEMDTSAFDREPQVSNLPAGGASWSFLGVFGLHVSLWRFSVGAEVAAGARETLFSYCGDQRSCAQEQVESAGQVEGRLRFEVFPVPNWSLGVMYGHSMIDADAQSLMVFTGLHFRALDGMP